MKLRILTALFLMIVTLQAISQQGRGSAQEKTIAGNGYNFTVVADIKSTPVKNQASTGTCWCFATTSLIESELLRMGKGEYDLSEMYIVRYNYIDRLKDNYLRQGKGNLGEGSLAHDWMAVFSKAGIVPEEAYPGLNYGSPVHNHGELNAFINAVAHVPVQRKNESLQYRQIVDAIFDIYFGKTPETFTYKGKTYTPKSFAESLDIKPDDYVEITSFTHFPFYTKGLVEVPDNWRMEKMWNVPLDELIQIMDYALANGYTVVWDGDVSERGFSHADGIAVIPETIRVDDFSKTDRSRSEKLATREQSASSGPVKELKVTQEIRQAGYENFSTTDDHLMHITGLVKDQNGTKYYKTKNSWGTDRNNYGGYLNISESYVRAKTIFIMVHKNGLPPAIKSKLGIV